MLETIGDENCFKEKIIRNKFIDGFEMLLGRQLINQKNKDILQTNLMAAIKMYD